MSLWRQRDFMRLWAGETVSVLGSQLTYLALPLAAVLTLHASAFQMGLLAAAGMAPWIVLALLAGVWVDRQPRRRWILIATDLGQAALLCSIPLAAALGALGFAQLIVVAFLSGILALFFRLAYSSYLPTLIEREQLVDGNSKLMTSYAGGQIAGPSIAGLLVQAVTAPFAILLDAGSFLVSAFMLHSIKAAEPPREPVRGASIKADLGAGLGMVARDPLLRAIAGSAATLNFFGTAQLAIIVLYASRELGMSPGLIGAAFAAGAVGGLLGAIGAGRVSQMLGLGPTILWATIGFPLALAIVPLAGYGEPRLVAAGVLAAAEFVGGIAVMLFDVNGAALRQAETPQQLLGRLGGAMSFLTQSAKPLGALFAGSLATAVGLHPTLWICAAGGLLVIPWTVCSPLRRREPPERLGAGRAPGQDAGLVPVADGLDRGRRVKRTLAAAGREALEHVDEPGVPAARGAAEVAWRRPRARPGRPGLPGLGRVAAGRHEWPSELGRPCLPGRAGTPPGPLRRRGERSLAVLPIRGPASERLP